MQQRRSRRGCGHARAISAREKRGVPDQITSGLPKTIEGLRLGEAAR